MEIDTPITYSVSCVTKEGSGIFLCAPGTWVIKQMKLKNSEQRHLN